MASNGGDMWNPEMGNVFRTAEPNLFRATPDYQARNGAPQSYGQGTRQARPPVPPPAAAAQQQQQQGIEWNQAALAATFAPTAARGSSMRSPPNPFLEQPRSGQQQQRARASTAAERVGPPPANPFAQQQQQPAVRPGSIAMPPRTRQPDNTQPGPSIDDLALRSLDLFASETAASKSPPPARQANPAPMLSSQRAPVQQPQQAMLSHSWSGENGTAWASQPASATTSRPSTRPNSALDLGALDALRVSEASAATEVSSSGSSFFGSVPANPFAANPFTAKQQQSTRSPTPSQPSPGGDLVNFEDGLTAWAPPAATTTTQNGGATGGETTFAVPAAPEDADEASASKRRREKKHALDELLQTEQTYRDQLGCFVDKLQKPLCKYCECLEQESQRAGPTTLQAAAREDARSLHRAFRPLPAEQLLALSTELVGQLRDRVETAASSGAYQAHEGDAVRVGDVFEAMSARLKDAMITWYDWHERAEVELRRLAGKSVEAKAFVALASSDPRCSDGQVSSLLIAPTQRLVRQMLFLERLAKTTPESHPDSVHIRRAYGLWRESLEACNVSAGNRTMQRRAEAVNRVLDGAPENLAITAQGRLLTHEGGLFKIGANSMRPDYFFLFETHSTTELLHASSPDSSGRFQFKRFLRVLHVEDVDLANSGDDPDLASGTVKRSSLYTLSAPKLDVATTRVSLGGSSSQHTPGGGAADAADASGICDLLLRVVAVDPYDKKTGHVYSLAGDAKSIVAWKSKVTTALNKSSAEWKLRFKGDVTVLAEAHNSYVCSEVKDASRDAFMWFFSGRFGGMIVRATTANARSGKLMWKELLAVDKVEAGPVRNEHLKGDRLRKKVAALGDDVFKIVANHKTLVLASEDKQLIVELMKPS